MRTRHVTAAFVAAAMIGIGSLAACAGDPDDPRLTPSPAGPTTPAPTPPVPSPPELPAPTPPAAPPAPVSPSPPLTVEAALTGQVIAGVTAGCKLIATDRGEYLLLGELARDLEVGATVTVRGEVRADAATICQQGTPFQVTEVLR